MKVMVVGGGGREHAIIKKLKESNKITEIYALPGNGGIEADAVCVDVKATDLEGQVKFAVENNIDFAVVAPLVAMIVLFLMILFDLNVTITPLKIV